MTMRGLLENININSGVRAPFQDIVFNGYGGAMPSVTNGSINDLSFNYAVADLYTQQYYNGFYLKTNAVVAIKQFNSIIANETLYKIHLQQIMNDGTVNEIWTPFRVDDIGVVPTVRNVDFDISSPMVYTYVSGIYILNTTVSNVPLSCVVDNLARYYYVSGGLLTYIFFIDGGIEEESMVINDINVGQGTDPNSYDDNNNNRPAKAIISFNQKKTIIFGSNIFSKTLKLVAVAKNLMGSSLPSIEKAYNVLIDPKSIALVNAISGSNIPNPYVGGAPGQLGLRTS
jgi:hypothetical protein